MSFASGRQIMTSWIMSSSPLRNIRKTAKSSLRRIAARAPANYPYPHQRPHFHLLAPISIFAKNRNMDQLTLGIGTRLQHTQFGPGVIVGVKYAVYLISFIHHG